MKLFHLWKGGQFGDDSCELEVKGEAVVGQVLHLKPTTGKLSSVLRIRSVSFLASQIRIHYNFYGSGSFH
jgi:hypothetical protein